MNDNSIKGLSTELYCMLAFTKRNFILSQPISNDSRYDFIADVNGKFLRIQCKTSKEYEDGDCIKFRLKTTNQNNKTEKPYSKDEIDYFYTWYNDQDFLVPVEEAGKQVFTLRFNSKNPTNPSIHWGKDYNMDKILARETL